MKIVQACFFNFRAGQLWHWMCDFKNRECDFGQIGYVFVVSLVDFDTYSLTILWICIRICYVFVVNFVDVDTYSLSILLIFWAGQFSHSENAIVGSTSWTHFSNNFAKSPWRKTRPFWQTWKSGGHTAATMHALAKVAPQCDNCSLFLSVIIVQVGFSIYAPGQLIKKIQYQYQYLYWYQY